MSFGEALLFWAVQPGADVLIWVLLVVLFAVLAALGGIAFDAIKGRKK